MPIETDLMSLDGLESQICIVGSGPVGACLAFDLAERGLSVVVLESGGRTPQAKPQSLSEAVIEKPRFHEAMSLATCRALGGTSWLWGGRCTELNEINFALRDYIPNSTWPISYRDVARFYPRAAELLGIGTGVLRATGPYPDGDLQVDEVEVWANETRIHERLRQFAAFDRIRFVLDATVVDLEIDAQKQLVSGVVVANEKHRITYRGAQHYVLALGGVETPRLLLNVQLREPNLFGGRDGALGRFYMGHVSGKIADISFSDPAKASQFAFKAHPNSASRARLTLSRTAQERHGLPNIAFWPDNPDLADPAHENGFLSFAYLLLNLPGLGSRFIPEAIRKTELRDKPQYLAHLRNCLADLPRLLSDSADFVRQRWQEGRRIPRWFDVNTRGLYRLHYHGEQRPNPENRITLAADRDELGMRRASISFEFSSEDIDGVYRAHEVLDRALRRASMGELHLKIPREEFLVARDAYFPDGLHQIGATRMAAAPANGVVDGECRVFGLNNLFIAGSSVFCTSGQANPTFPAVALALRLAAHLERSVESRTYHAYDRAKPLKLLHVVPSIDASSGGPSRAVFDLALAARARGHDVTIYATDFGGTPVEHSEYLQAGVKLEAFPIFGPEPIQYSRNMGRRIAETIKSFDIVHLHSVYMPHDWQVYRYATKYGIPYFLRPHGTFDPIIRERKRLVKWVLGKGFQNTVTAAAAGIHYTSEDERRLSDCANLNAWVVPLPIRPEEFAGPIDETFRARYDLKRDFILFLGRLAWKKGADIAIEALAAFSKRWPEVDLVIAGPDFGEEAKLRAQVASLNLQSRVRFTGMLDGPARIAAYKLAKLFLVPSRGENFGRTVAEAMIVGTPILMTNCIGIWKDLVEADAACVAEADIASIVAALDSVWNAYPMALERAARAKKLVDSQFSIAAVGEQLERMYYAALPRPRGMIGSGRKVA